MKFSQVKPLLKVRFVQIPLAAIALSQIFVWTYTFWFIRPTEELIILHYTTAFGVDFLGPWRSLFIVPIVGLVFTALNMVLVLWFWERIRALSWISLATSVLINVTLVGVSVMLVFLNT